MTPGALCRGPEMHVAHREPLGTRWCFVCREHQPFTITITTPIEPSYYGPHPRIHCPRGHVDGDLFPGRTRTWE